MKPPLNGEEDIAYGDYWLGFECQEAAAEEVLKFFNEQAAWTDDARFFGTDNGDQIEIWSNSEIRCRFDMRDPDLEILESILRLARKFKLMLVSSDSLEVIIPEMALVAMDIQESTAMKFCTDPEGYLRSLDERR